MKRLITSKWLEKIVNRYLALDPECLAKLAALKGKVLCVHVLGLNKRYFIVPEDNHVNVNTHWDSAPDTTIKGMPFALLKLSKTNDVAPLMLSGEIEIIGDVRLGKTFKKCFSELNIDWEEHLSSVIGDVPANTAFNLARKVSAWTKQIVSSVTDDMSEYLQEESRDIVSGAELEGFNTKVDQLRDDVDRMAAILKQRL